MAVYFKNNNIDGAFMVDCLGQYWDASYGELTPVDDIFDFDEELLDNEEFINVLKTKKIIIYIDNRELSTKEAIEYYSTTPELLESDNVKYNIKDNSDVVVDEYTQFRIYSRPLIVSSNSSIELGEGSDLILDI